MFCCFVSILAVYSFILNHFVASRSKGTTNRSDNPSLLLSLYFQGIIQDVKLIFAPNGYITQCPNLNRTCPTCSDFLSLVQGIMDLQELLAKMTLKLNYAESRLTHLEGCHCERTCSTNGLVYRDKELWVEPENCRNCVCKNGVVECRRVFCPPANCSDNMLPVHVDGTCCKTCRPQCAYLGQTFSEGQRFLFRTCKECKLRYTCPLPSHSEVISD
ncbi:Protein kinase C-binding protein nell1 [Goodea atripinnis]|uniref:Protein kinase C-binding protein nell1 n=1 Tax=Goodea atripinnis TaxID=208336 RepID=A0ABV0PWV2_9TELE